MNYVSVGGGTIALACINLMSSAAIAEAPRRPAHLTPATARSTLNFKIEYTDFSKLYGDRVVASSEYRRSVAKDTQVAFTVSAGRKRAGGDTKNATLASAAIDHDWSGHLSTHTVIGLANNGSIFAKRQIATDLNYALGNGLVGTIGGRYADYGNGNSVTTWSAGAAYYFRGASLSYRYNLLDSHQLGRSHAHLASSRFADPAGSGSTQLWVGRGSSLYDVSTSPTAVAGKFTSVAVRRQQPIASGLAINAGVNRTWYETPTGSYRGLGVSLGLTLARFP